MSRLIHSNSFFFFDISFFPSLIEFATFKLACGFSSISSHLGSIPGMTENTEVCHNFLSRKQDISPAQWDFNELKYLTCLPVIKNGIGLRRSLVK